MSLRFLSIILLLVSCNLSAQPWQFNNVLPVTSVTGNSIFHHLDSSGRRHVAVSGKTVAVVWEDNRDRQPAIYLARKQITAEHFSPEIKISTTTEAYEPTIVALGEDRFVVAWEQSDHIHLRTVLPDKLGPVMSIDDVPGVQVSLAVLGQQVHAVFSALRGRYQQIRYQSFLLKGNGLLNQQACMPEKGMVSDHQYYPVIVATDKEILIAWEDRRPGHTIIMATRRHLSDQPCRFQSPQQVSDPPVSRKSPYGKGHGVARVALARYGQGAMAVWADKRDYRQGYDIYSAARLDKSTRLFGQNKIVQDSFGGQAHQWHPAITGHANGQLVVVWDDNRDGDANIVYSWLQQGGWSEDITLDDETGLAEQSHPSVCMDAKGNLHVVWIDRASKEGPTRLRYSMGVYRTED